MDSVTIQIPTSLTQTYRRPAWITLWQGWLPSGTTPSVTKNNSRIAAQVHVRSTWPDGSAKHLHIYAAWDAYDAGDVYKLWNGDTGTQPTPPAIQSNISISSFLADWLNQNYEPTDETIETLDSGTIARVVHTSGTMGGSGGSAFDPNVLDSTVCWLKADSLSLNNNDPVSSWTDSSGNSHGATASSGARPLYKTNVVNSKPALLFDGVDDEMQIANLGTAMSADNTYEIFMVFSIAGSLASGPMVLSYPVGSYSDFRLFFNNFGASSKGGMHWGELRNNYLFYDFQLDTPSAWTMAGFSKTDVDSGNVYKFGNSVASAFGAGLTGQNAMTGNMLLGSGWVNTTQFHTNFYLAELIVCTDQLTTEDRQRVEGYLAEKYGMRASLAADHPYKSVAPTNEHTAFLTYDRWETYYSDRIDVKQKMTVLPAPLPIAELRINCTPPIGWNTFLRNESVRAPFTFSGTDLILWPSGGTTPVVVGEANLHKRPWEHSGEYLQLLPPSDARSYAVTYAAAYPSEGEDGSSQLVGNIDDYDPRGRNITVEFSFEHPSYDITARRTMLQLKPVPRLSPVNVCATGAFGLMAARSVEYATHETNIENAVLSFNSQTKAGQQHSHWNDWGQTAEAILTYGSVTRPVVKRCVADHYGQEGLGVAVIRGAGQSVIDCFRQAADFTRAIIQCDYAGDHLHKVQWGFSHGKASIFPDGTSGPHAASGDTDFDLTGHWPHPYLLLLSWLIDCDWDSKLGYDSWFNAVDLTEDQYGREPVATLLQGLHALRYYGSDFPAGKLTDLQGMATTLIGKPFATQYAEATAGQYISPLFDPLWMYAADEILNTVASEAYIVASATFIATLATTWNIEATTEAVFAQAYYLSGTASFLDPIIPTHEPTASGSGGLQIGPGPLGERFELTAWPLALHYLELATANELSLTFPMEICTSASYDAEITTEASYELTL